MGSSVSFRGVRAPAVAGSFYPADPAELEAVLDRCFAEAAGASAPDPPATPALSRLEAVVAPHAGYRYSGAVAGSAFAEVRRAARSRAGGSFRRVVLLGPAHYVAVRGLAASSARAFATPLGDVPVDTDAVAAALTDPDVQVDDGAHAPEHSLETHLPFLQRALGDFTLVPLVVGRAPPGVVARVLERLARDPGTLVSVSTDLSHDLAYEDARGADAGTAAAIEALDAEAIGPDRACGHAPLAGLLLWARGRRSRARTLDLRSSGDADAPRHRVVGYGAFVVEGPAQVSGTPP